jgi:hypothetical protein
MNQVKMDIADVRRPLYTSSPIDCHHAQDKIYHAPVGPLKPVYYQVAFIKNKRGAK